MDFTTGYDVMHGQTHICRYKKTHTHTHFISRTIALDSAIQSFSV